MPEEPVVKHPEDHHHFINEVIITDGIFHH